MNSYSYGNNNPITNKDPLGLFAMSTGKVEKGDTLSGITQLFNKTFGINLTTSGVASANGIKNSNKIGVGDSIIVPKTNLELRFNNDISTLYVMDKTYGNGFNDLKWTAVSGIDGKYDPIAKGLWRTVDPNDKTTKGIQYWSDVGFKQPLSNFGLTNFPGGTKSWGTQRTELHNLEGGPQTGYYIHGGDNPGSRGCIDLTNQNDSFHDWFRSNGTPLDLVVE